MIASLRRARLGVCVVVLFCTSLPLRAADHNDAPLIAEDPSVDLLDVFAFVNPNNDRVVLAMTVNGFTVPAALGIGFATNALYQFKIDNTGDFVEDLVIQATFTKIGSNQMFTVVGPGRPRRLGSVNNPLRGNNLRTITGPANGSVVTDGNFRVFAGVRDDPFFVDLVWVLRLLGLQPGGPLGRQAGIDFIGGLNCSVLAIELPAAQLRGSTGNTIRVWGSASRHKTTRRGANKDDKVQGQFVQVDRTALPVINTVLISGPSGFKKDQFNRTSPVEDVQRFRGDAVAALVRINNNQQLSQSLVDGLLLPDVLTLDMTSTAGFPNGRRPEDDVIDIVLNAASDGAVTSDNVDANDLPYLNDFPFFAPPHGPEAGVPPRN